MRGAEPREKAESAEEGAWSCPRRLTSLLPVIALWVGLVLVALPGSALAARAPHHPPPAPEPDRAYHIALEAPGQGTVRLYAEEHGHGRPILLLHGLGASTFTWRNIIPALARQHRVIAIDFKGFGRSDKPFTQAYTPYDHANLVLAFIRKRGLRDLTIVGHSYGGAIGLLVTMRLNETSPGRVRDLVLMNAPTYRQPGTAFVHFMNSPVLPYAALTLIPPELSTWLSLDKVQADKLSFEEVRAYAQPFYSAAARHALITTARRIIPRDVDRLTAAYPKVGQPTLVIWCDADHTVPIETGIRLANTLRRARLEVLTGCGHVPQDERPDAVIRLLQSFLSR